MASAAVRSKALVLLLFIHCLLLLPLLVLLLGSWFVLQYFVTFIILQSSAGEERAGCFTLVVF